MGKRPRLIVFGAMGRAPFAGMAWQALQYLEGFRRLGCDVYYLEDTKRWPFVPEQGDDPRDCRYTVQYIARLMAWCGLPGRWAYRAESRDGELFGLSESSMLRLIREAEALVNLSSSMVMRDEYLRVPIRVYLETDPVEPQVRVAQGSQRTIDYLGAHTHHFTYGENFGAPDCGVPLGRFDYRPIRQPVVLDWWTPVASRPLPTSPRIPTARRFTTIGNWKQSGRDIEWNGETYYWSKHLEFLKFIDLPGRTGQPFELALASAEADEVQLLTSHGWRIVDAIALSKDIAPYREYILGSHGEFTIAKDQNVRLRSGWFSDRSACYLAAGRPVITQDTGFGNVLPTGEGLFAFTTVEEIMTAIDEINGDYERQRRAARAIAGKHFRAESVLARILDDLGF